MTKRNPSHTDRWHTEPLPNTAYAAIKDENGLTVGQVIKEDAPLVAAAPELLAVVRAFVEAWDNDSVAHLEQAARDGYEAIARAEAQP